MTRLAQKSSEEDSMYIYWNKCVSNMYNKIKFSIFLSKES